MAAAPALLHGAVVRAWIGVLLYIDVNTMSAFHTSICAQASSQSYLKDQTQTTPAIDYDYTAIILCEIFEDTAKRMESVHNLVMAALINARVMRKISRPEVDKRLLLDAHCALVHATGNYARA